jgi:glycosyltransferase involved in cell wall biosynthesis
VTQLSEDRKIEELLRAADESPDVYVILAGSGVMEERIARAAVTNPRIIFAGFVSGGLIGDYTCAADVIYYGFDPENPNARFSAPNKLFEALAAGRPLITGDFGEIAEVVRKAHCGIVLPEYSVAEIKKALRILADPERRSRMAHNAAEIGRTSLNWDKAEEILYQEYSSLLPGLREPGRETCPNLAQAAVGQ